MKGLHELFAPDPAAKEPKLADVGRKSRCDFAMHAAERERERERETLGRSPGERKERETGRGV